MPLSPPADGKTSNSNGHIHGDDAERYKKTGWAPRFGTGSITEEKAGESLLDHTTLLESKIDDKFFGGMSTSSISNLRLLTVMQTGTTMLQSSCSRV